MYSYCFIELKRLFLLSHLWRQSYLAASFLYILSSPTPGFLSIFEPLCRCLLHHISPAHRRLAEPYISRCASRVLLLATHVFLYFLSFVLPSWRFSYYVRTPCAPVFCFRLRTSGPSSQYTLISAHPLSRYCVPVPRTAHG